MRGDDADIAADGQGLIVRENALASLLAHYALFAFLSPPLPWPVEGARRRELAELVADHVLGDQHRNVLLAVVDAEGEAHELRQDRRAARPGLDHVLAAACRAWLPPS